MKNHFDGRAGGSFKLLVPRVGASTGNEKGDVVLNVVGSFRTIHSRAAKVK